MACTFKIQAVSYVLLGLLGLSKKKIMYKMMLKIAMNMFLFGGLSLAKADDTNSISKS